MNEQWEYFDGRKAVEQGQVMHNAYRICGSRVDYRHGPNPWACSGLTTSQVRKFCIKVADEHTAIHGQPEQAETARWWFFSDRYLVCCVSDKKGWYQANDWPSSSPWQRTSGATDHLLSAKLYTEFDELAALALIATKGWSLPPCMEQREPEVLYYAAWKEGEARSGALCKFCNNAAFRIIDGKKIEIRHTGASASWYEWSDAHAARIAYFREHYTPCTESEALASISVEEEKPAEAKFEVGQYLSADFDGARCDVYRVIQSIEDYAISMETPDGVRSSLTREMAIHYVAKKFLTLWTPQSGDAVWDSDRGMILEFAHGDGDMVDLRTKSGSLLEAARVDIRPASFAPAEEPAAVEPVEQCEPAVEPDAIETEQAITGRKWKAGDTQLAMISANGTLVFVCGKWQSGMTHKGFGPLSETAAIAWMTDYNVAWPEEMLKEILDSSCLETLDVLG